MQCVVQKRWRLSLLAALLVTRVFGVSATEAQDLKSTDARTTQVIQDVKAEQVSPFPKGKPAGIAKDGLVRDNPAIDFSGFVQLAAETESMRNKRRVPLALFLEMAREPHTIILDTRSKLAFEVAHWKGAIHLNFSDFTEDKLRKVIPDKKTRILIYCNNNFIKQGREGTEKPILSSSNVLDPDGSLTVATVDDSEEVIASVTTNKKPTLALNIPTFINLVGYGYQNVYELADQIPLNDPDLPLEGTAVESDK